MNSQQKAQLQTLGVALYESIDSIDVTSMPWLKDVCALLNVGMQDCVFDSPKPYFDDETKQLHLPKTFHNSEVLLKKAIWQNIQQSVND